MGVSIKSAEAERKLRRVSRLLGKSMTATVIELADGKLREIDAKKDRERRLRKIDEIVVASKRCLFCRRPARTRSSVTTTRAPSIDRRR